MTYNISLIQRLTLVDLVSCDYDIGAPVILGPEYAPSVSQGIDVLPGSDQQGIYSSTYSIKEEVYFDGVSQLTGDEVWRYIENSNNQLAGFSVYLHSPRLAGVIDIVMKVNGLVKGADQINNAQPQSFEVENIDLDIQDGDYVTFEVTSTSLDPLSNQLDIYLIFN